jgi:hypothetical protein
VSVIFYPVVKKNNYVKQKTCDFVLAASSFCMILFLSNNQSDTISFFNASNATSFTSVSVKSEKPTAEEILASLKHRDKSSLSKTEKRILKKEFKEQIKIYTKAKLTGNKNTAGDALLIMLAIIAALGLLYILAALACAVSCNGSEGAAIIIALLGTAAIILGLVLVIKRITRGPRKKEEEGID